MSSQLTYRPREGIVFGTVAGTAIRLATLRHQAGMDLEAWRQAAQSAGTDARITDWQKKQEIRTGAAPAGAIQHRLTVAENAALEIYDYPGVASERIGRETVTYVSNIYKYYVAYRLMGEQRARREAAKAEAGKRK